MTAVGNVKGSGCARTKCYSVPMTEQAPDQQPVVEICDLVKCFGDQVVLDGVNLQVMQGEIFP